MSHCMPTAGTHQPAHLRSFIRPECIILLLHSSVIDANSTEPAGKLCCILYLLSKVLRNTPAAGSDDRQHPGSKDLSLHQWLADTSSFCSHHGAGNKRSKTLRNRFSDCQDFGMKPHSHFKDNLLHVTLVHHNFCIQPTSSNDEPLLNPTPLA